MSSSSRERKRERYGFDLSFATLEEKEAFLQRLQNVRRLMTPAGAPLLENQNLVYALLDLAESGSLIRPLTPIAIMLAQLLGLSCATVVSYGKCYGMSLQQ